MEKSEELVKLFLRLNGYFVVENFIIHDGNSKDIDSINKIIPQLTETDMLGIRLPFQNEKTGDLHIANHKKIVLNKPLIDLIIIESKTGTTNKPNKTWKNDSRIDNIKYIIRFFGLTDNALIIEEISKNLITKYNYDWGDYSIRFIIVSESENEYYSKKGVTYITIDEILNFIIETRGKSWINANMGIASQHQQWSIFMNKIFIIANKKGISNDDKKLLIRKYVGLTPVLTK